MQAAYREKQSYIASIQPDLDAQREECEEAETRAQHLRVQLEDMSRVAVEQETLIAEMAEKLGEEKLRSEDARERIDKLEKEKAQRSRKVSVRMVTPDGRAEDQDVDDEDDDSSTSPSTRKAKRASAGSRASDSGFESCEDTAYAESITSSLQTGTTTPETEEREVKYGEARQVAFDKVRANNIRSNVWSRGGSAAYPATQALRDTAVVESLRGENEMLRRRVGEMERSLQGCIDLVSAVQG